MPIFRFGEPPIGSIHGNAHRVAGNVRLRSSGSFIKADINSGDSYSASNRFNPVFDKLEQGSVLEDWVPRDAPGINMMFRRIDGRDPIVGPAITIYASLPWSEFDIRVSDPAVKKLYEEAFSYFTPQIMTMIAREFLVIGRACASMVFNPKKGYFDRYLWHDPDFLEITTTGLQDFNPLIDLRISPAQRYFMASQDERIQRMRAMMPPQFLEKFAQTSGKIPLDQYSTLFAARKMFLSDQIGTSMLTRVVGLWALEKALMDASVTAARRRAGTMIHVTVGSDTWEPSDAELDAHGNLFIQADEDPVGAVVTTRPNVTATEIKQGGQLWKLSDEWPFLAEAKMRALGISEAVLSADACMVGSSMVPSLEHGIVRIGDLGNKENGKWSDLSLTVGSRYGTAKTKKWYYNGVKPTLKVTTTRGYPVEVTYNQPLLVLNDSGETVWRRADALSKGDLLCFPSNKVLRTTLLNLNLADPTNVVHGGQRKPVKKPQVMTPDLAFFLGLVVSEGSISKTSSQIRFSNSNSKLLERFQSLATSLFGLETSVHATATPSKEYAASFKSSKNCYDLIICSKTLVEWFDHLGCYADGNQDGVTASHHKHVPWSILQADAVSQHAYMAAYIEGDGSLASSEHITIHSASDEMLTELQVLFATHGAHSKRYEDRISFNYSEFREVQTHIEPFLVSKRFQPHEKFRSRLSFGVPMKFWSDLIRSRKTGNRTHQGVEFVNDDGCSIFVKNFESSFVSLKKLSYDSYETGKYDEALGHLEQISKDAHTKLIRLLGNRYRYIAIDTIENAGEQETYDLSMDDGVEPAFVVNGAVHHNTYNNMESAKALWVEQIVNFRQQLTDATMGWVAEQLARAHGFVKNDKRAAYKGQIRVGPSKSEASWEPYRSDDRQNGYRVQAVEEQLMHRIRQSKHISIEKAMGFSREELLLPIFQFKKDMKPRQDQAWIEMLEKLEEKGIPVPLRMYSQAADYDIDTALEMMPENQKLLDKIAELTGGGMGAGETPTGEPAPEGGGNGMEKLDNLLDQGGGGIPPPGGGGGGEVSPEKPPKSGPTPENPVDNPAPPSAVKPQRNPMASLIQKLPIFHAERFAGIKRSQIVALSDAVYRMSKNTKSRTAIANGLVAKVRATFPKHLQGIALYLCARSGMPVEKPFSMRDISMITHELKASRLNDKQLAQELFNLSTAVAKADKKLMREVTSKPYTDSFDNLPADSPYLIGGLR